MCGQAEQVSTIVTMAYCLFILVYFQLKIEDSVFQWQNFEILFMEAYESLSKYIYDLIVINSTIFEQILNRHSAIALFENGAMESYFFYNNNKLIIWSKEMKQMSKWITNSSLSKQKRLPAMTMQIQFLPVQDQLLQTLNPESPRWQLFQKKCNSNQSKKS